MQRYDVALCLNPYAETPEDAAVQAAETFYNGTSWSYDVTAEDGTVTHVQVARTHTFSVTTSLHA